MFASRTSLRPSDVALRALIVALALGTAYIHSTLGGLLFTLNSIGYVTAAVAMVIPLALAVRFRWVVRLGLIGYAVTDFARHDGSPVNVIRRELAAFGSFVADRRGTAAAGA